MKNNYPKSLDILLTEYKFKSHILQNIKQHSKNLIKINNIVLNLLPKKLKKWCHIANYRQKILILEVGNASRKIRIHYEIPRLIFKLRNSILPSLSTIEIIINPEIFIEEKTHSIQKNIFNKSNLIQIKKIKKIINQTKK